MDSSVSGGRAEEDGVEEYSVGAHTAMYTFYPSIRPALENRSIYSYDRRMLPVDATAEDAAEVAAALVAAAAEEVAEAAAAAASSRAWAWKSRWAWAEARAGRRTRKEVRAAANFMADDVETVGYTTRS